MQDEAWTMAQQSVLGSCLIDQRAVGSVVFSLEEADFQDVNQSIFTIIRDKYLSGKPVDPVCVVDALGGGAECREYVVQLMQITPTASNIRYYADICRERSRIARYRDIGKSLADVTSSAEAAEIVRNCARIQLGKGMESWTMAEALKNFFGRYNKKVEYLPWFLGQLNGQLAMEFGDFCLLGGRPSSGKSAFALEAAIYWAVVGGYRVGFYSCETSREKLTNRMISACARVPLDAVKRSGLSSQELEAVSAVAARIAEAPIDLISAAGKTVAEIQAFALAQRHQIVIVDYLQIISDPGKDEYAQVSNISKQLHTMCQSMKIFCLALCQLNRTKGSRPTLEDLRSSGQLEQDADAVVFLHQQESCPGERELIIAKNKEGECRTTRLCFEGPIQHFSYIGKGDKPLAGVDYGRQRAQPRPEDSGFQQISMDTEVPFEQ